MTTSVVRPRTVVITGATSGIGKVAAQTLADGRTNLVLTGRNLAAGRRLAHTLARRGPTTVEFVQADISRQADVCRLASSIIAHHDAVDVLVNNAGARIDRYRQTDDGVEATFATNHLGHFLLTCLLAERLAAAPAARVITVASSAHFSAPPEPVWNLDRDSYDRRVAYATSKLANVMFAYELARRIESTTITSNAVDPGIVATNFARNNGLVPWLKHLVSYAIRRELTTPRHGAATIVDLATRSDLRRVSGKYFKDKREVASSRESYNSERARDLWRRSAQMTGLLDHRWSKPQPSERA